MSSLFKKTSFFCLVLLKESSSCLIIIGANLVIDWIGNIMIRISIWFRNATSFIKYSIIDIGHSSLPLALGSLNIALAHVLRSLLLRRLLISQDCASTVRLIVNGLKLRRNNIFRCSWFVGLINIRTYNHTFTDFLLCFAFFSTVILHLLIINIRHYVMRLHVIKVESLKEIKQRLLSFFKFVKELLSMRPGLSWCSRLNVLLYFFPFLSINF